VRVLVPRTYHADGMLLYCDAADEPVLAVMLEVQRGWDAHQAVDVGTLEIREAQKRAWDNKIAKGFNTQDVALEFGLLTAEVGEAFTAWRKRLPDFAAGCSGRGCWRLTPLIGPRATGPICAMSMTEQ
jgi:hypothetical protein